MNLALHRTKCKNITCIMHHASYVILVKYVLTCIEVHRQQVVYTRIQDVCPTNLPKHIVICLLTLLHAFLTASKISL